MRFRYCSSPFSENHSCRGESFTVKGSSFQWRYTQSILVPSRSASSLGFISRSSIACPPTLHMSPDHRWPGYIQYPLPRPTQHNPHRRHPARFYGWSARRAGHFFVCCEYLCTRDCGRIQERVVRNVRWSRYREAADVRQRLPHSRFQSLRQTFRLPWGVYAAFRAIPSYSVRWPPNLGGERPHCSHKRVGDVFPEKAAPP
jgi:hypothetical protein